jgi:hypothetical protein
VAELSTVETSLEDAFVDLTKDAVEYRARYFRGGEMSTLQVTQARVMKSEWTKLRTQPGALWSLLSAVILVVAFGILYSLLRVARPPHGGGGRLVRPDLGQPGRGAARADRGRGARRAADHQRVRHRADPDHAGGGAAAAAHAVGQGGGGDRRGGRGERPGRGRGLPGRAGDPGPPAPVGVVR